MGIPAIVNAACDVLKGQVTRSGGGWAYWDVESFAEAVLECTRSPARRLNLGMHGLRYLRRNYSWRRVERAYRRALESIQGRETCCSPPPGTATRN